MGLLTGLSYALGLSVFALYAALAAGRRVPRAAAWALASLAVVVTLARCERLYGEGTAAGDYYAFYASGRAVLTGGDPYAARTGPVDAEAPGIANGNVALNPPSALPLFALFGLMPVHVGYLAFAAANLGLALALAALAARALAPPGGRSPADDASPLVAATLLVSWSCFLGIATGQVSLIAATAIAAGLAAQGAGRPYLAGACLALATVKPNTLLPFLLLFLNRRDLKTWAALALTTAALILIATPPAAVPGRLAAILGRIGEYGGPGRINDPSFANGNSVSILGLDRVMYCLGLTRRSVVSAAQAAILAAAGLALARRVLFDLRAERAASIALVSIYAALFFYHRQGDAVLLTLPLAYAVAGLLGGDGPRGRRVALGLAVVSMLVTLYVPGSMVKSAWDRLAVRGGPAASGFRVTVLPLANYGLIAAFAAIWAAAAIGEGSGRAPDLATTPRGG